MADTRMSRIDTLVTMAHAVEGRSSCMRNRVGALIVHGGRPIMTGYNGAPAGMPHCDHTTCDCGQFAAVLSRNQHAVGCATQAPCKIAVHAEANAIAYAAREGVKVDGAHLVVTLSPCLACAQLIVSAGISAVTYVRTYRDLSGLELLTSAGLTVERYT